MWAKETGISVFNVQKNAYTSCAVSRSTNPSFDFSHTSCNMPTFIMATWGEKESESSAWVTTRLHSKLRVSMYLTWHSALHNTVPTVNTGEAVTLGAITWTGSRNTLLSFFSATQSSFKSASQNKWQTTLLCRNHKGYLWRCHQTDLTPKYWVLVFVWSIA